MTQHPIGSPRPRASAGALYSCEVRELAKLAGCRGSGNSASDSRALALHRPILKYANLDLLQQNGACASVERRFGYDRALNEQEQDLPGRGVGDVRFLPFYGGIWASIHGGLAPKPPVRSSAVCIAWMS